MKALYPKAFGLALMAAFVLMSCGGGGGAGGGLSAGGGIDGSGFVSQGSVSAFGSIVVNGTEFDTSNAALVIKGVGVGVGDGIVMENLDIGRVVTVEGRQIGDADTFVADRVLYRNNVEGPVTRMQVIDNVTKEVVVLGQTVVVNAVTQFENTTFDALAPNDLLEVSGFYDDTGLIYATFIGKTGEFSPEMDVEVTGYVVNLDARMKTFEINHLSVDYSQADTNSLPGGMPAEGMRVEAEGALDATGRILIAAQIQLDDDLSAVDAEGIEVTGFVTDQVSPLEFTVGSQPVQADAATLFIDGTQENVALGVKLEVEGTLVNGILFAQEIEFWGPNQIEIEGFVTAIVSPSEFTVGNHVVHTDSSTVFEGGVPAEIALGVQLEVKGVPADIDRSILVADKVTFEQE